MKAATTLDASTRWMASLLHGNSEALDRLRNEPAESFLSAASANGALGLVGRSLRTSGHVDQLPVGVRDRILTTCWQDQALELARRVQLARIFDALAEAGVPALVFKGGALAYTYYPSPHLRPRVDTDLFVRDEDRARAGSVLKTLGYRLKLAVDRDAIFTQAMFCLDTGGHLLHPIDLHWKIANRPFFRELLSFEEFAREAVVVSSVSASAKAPSSVHSLLLACIHPVAHHHCEWPLIWLNDVHLIGESLSAAEWHRFRALARTKRVSLICKRTFQMARECFGETRWLLDSGILDVSDEADEPSAQYLDPDIGPARDLYLDLAGARGLMAKARLLFSHSFPDLRYMQETHGAVGLVGTAAAYAHRLTHAGAQLLGLGGGR